MGGGGAGQNNTKLYYDCMTKITKGHRALKNEKIVRQYSNSSNNAPFYYADSILRGFWFVPKNLEQRGFIL